MPRLVCIPTGAAIRLGGDRQRPITRAPDEVDLSIWTSRLLLHSMTGTCWKSQKRQLPQGSSCPR